MATNVAVIFYSATGNVHLLAEAIAEGAGETGAEVRLKRVAELAPRKRSSRTRSGPSTAKRTRARSRKPRWTTSNGPTASPSGRRCASATLRRS
jgi:hypothetical protein